MELTSLQCSHDTCTVTQLLPSATFPLTYDDTSLVWHACTSLAQLCHVQLHYYHSHLPFTPTYNGALHSETHSILPALATVVSSGLFVPTFSQPAVDESEYNGYYMRAGWPQRAAVSGWTSEVGVKRIRAQWHGALRNKEVSAKAVSEVVDPEAFDLHICIKPPSAHSDQSSPTSYCLHSPNQPCVIPISRTPATPTRPSIRQRLNLPPLHSDPPSTSDPHYTTTSVGGGETRRGKELEDWRRQLSGSGRQCVEVEGWMVWMVDEQWGRKQLLWQFLVEALTADH